MHACRILYAGRVPFEGWMKQHLGYDLELKVGHCNLIWI